MVLLSVGGTTFGGVEVGTSFVGATGIDSLCTINNCRICVTLESVACTQRQLNFIEF